MEEVPPGATMTSPPQDVGSWLRDEVRALEASNPVIKFVNDVYSMRHLLGGLTPTQEQAHTLPRRPSLPQLLDGEPPDEDAVQVWRVQHFGEEEAEELAAEQKALRDALQAEAEEKESEEASNSLDDVETYLREKREREAAAVVEAALALEDEFTPSDLKRSRSQLNLVEKAAREFRKETQPKSAQELEDEAQVPRKLAYWNAGHQEKQLQLAGKSLQKDDFYLLEFILRFNYPIVNVSLQKCFLTDEDALGLAEALTSNYVLTSLDLSRTKVTDATAFALADVLKDNAALKVLDLRLNDVSAKGAAYLATACRTARTLETLDGLPLRRYLEVPPEEIQLSDLDLRLPEAVLLRDTLQNNICVRVDTLDNFRVTYTLTSLDLSANLLDAEAVSVVADIAKTHTSLTSLDVSRNRAGPDGLTSLAHMLGKSTWLTTLKLAENNVTRANTEPMGVTALLDVLRTNRTLTALDIASNDIDPDLAVKIQARVSVNRAVRHTPASFVEFLDARYAPDEYETNDTGGYVVNLELSREYLETEKRTRPSPRVRFDEPQPYKPWRDADGGDDWSLLEPEPMRRATRAKLQRCRRLLEAHILAHKCLGFSASSALLALQAGLFAEAPCPAPGPAPAPAPSPAPAPAPPEAEAPLSVMDGRNLGPHASVSSLGPHASVTSFQTVVTDPSAQE